MDHSGCGFITAYEFSMLMKVTLTLTRPVLAACRALLCAARRGGARRATRARRRGRRPGLTLTLALALSLSLTLPLPLPLPLTLTLTLR